MKLEMQGSNTVTSANGGASFGAKIGAKSFWLLSSGIYSRKVLAVIREVSCNAQDAHIMGGQPDRPIEVWLPTIEKPVFQVRDYGSGLSEEEVFSLYTTYFESGKDSGDYSSGLFKTDGPIDLEKADAATGGFGLGSKSPFALTDQFTVTSVQNGVKRIYSCAVNHERVPETAKLWEGPADADWPSGIMVTVPVPLSSVPEFASEADAVFRAFDVKPVFLGELSSFQVSEEPELLVKLGPLSLRKSEDDNHRTIQVRMARVDYPLDVSALNLHGPLRAFMTMLAEHTKHNLVLEMPTGSIIPAPSREHLQYYKGAIGAITERLSQAMEAYKDGVLSRIADPASPQQAELAEVRNWLYRWMPVSRSLFEKINGEGPISATLGLLGLPPAARTLLLFGGMEAPKDRYGDTEVYVYVGSDFDVGGGVRRSQVLGGMVPSGSRDRTRLRLRAGVEVMYADGDRVDERVRMAMRQRVIEADIAKISRGAVTPIILLKARTGVKLSADALKDLATQYAGALLATPKPTSLLPAVTKSSTPAKVKGAASPRLTADERLRNAAVTAIVLDTDSMRYAHRELRFEEIMAKRLVGWQTPKRSYYSASRVVQNTDDLNTAITAMREGGVTHEDLKALLPEAIVRVVGAGNAGEKRVLDAVPGRHSISAELLSKLESLVGGPGVKTVNLQVHQRGWLRGLLQSGGMTWAELRSRLSGYTQPSPMLRILQQDLSQSKQLKSLIQGAKGLARTLDLPWVGEPTTAEPLLSSDVEGLAPTRATSIHAFLRILDVHEELWRAKQKQ